MIIYKTVNAINGKFYIGQDSNNNPEYYGSGTLLKRAIEKYGIKNFIKETLEVCFTKEELNEREKYWIKETKAQELGYNIAEGGSGGNTYDEETRQRISEQFKGRYVRPETIEKRKQTRAKNPEKYKLPEERKKTIGDFHRGKEISEEQRQKNSERMKNFTNYSPEFLEMQKGENRKGEKSPMWGKPVSEETRRKMSVSNSHYWLGKTQPPETVEKIKQTKENQKQKNPDRYKRTEELKENQRTKMMGEGNPFYGKTHTPEIRERLRQSKINKTPEQMLETYIKFYITRMGYQPSEEQKQKKLQEYNKKKKC
jgi:group I intron endonuclease